MTMGIEEDLDSFKIEFNKYKLSNEKALSNYVQRGDLEVKYVEFKIEIESMIQKLAAMEGSLLKVQNDQKQV